MTVSTIVALASGPGPSGVAVIRVSGPQAGQVVACLCGGLPVPRAAALRALKDANGETIDNALVIWFPAPASFTGEDVAEFQVHGGRAVVSDVIEACLKVENVALAKPGDFTRRAFENGKMDLSAAEGLADLIDAETRAQRRQALRQMEGALATQIIRWRESILDALADAEGDIDFPDEDLPPGLNVRARGRIATLRDELAQHLHESEQGMRIRDGYRVAILGAPNAGKSSLLNALARRDAAIVSPIAGTTRDVVEVRLVLAGHIVWLADTAGLRDAADEIEAQGISRALFQAENADLRIGVIENQSGRTPLDDLMDGDDIWVLGKSDVCAWEARNENEIVLSSHSGIGLEALEAAIVERARGEVTTLEAAPLTRLRHKHAVIATIDALERALSTQGHATELVAEDLRLAVRHLSEIIGRVDMEDVFDRLFAQFCIGK